MPLHKKKDENAKNVEVTISMPFKLLTYIEKERGFENRSSYITRILSEGLGLGEMLEV
jgi:hypothetical protein